MTQQTELEKTQLEIARLQLEQEKHKLAQMQRRSEAVSGLGRGAAKVGGGLTKGLKTTVAFLALAACGAVIGLCIAGAYIYVEDKSTCSAMYPGADSLYLIGCAYGQNPWSVLIITAFCALSFAVQGIQES